MLNLTGSAREVELEGRFDGPVFLQPQSHTSLSLIRAAQFKDDVVIGDNLAIENAKFENCVGLENFRFIGSYADSFPSNRGVVSRGGSTKGLLKRDGRLNEGPFGAVLERVGVGQPPVPCRSRRPAQPASSVDVLSRRKWSPDDTLHGEKRVAGPKPSCLRVTGGCRDTERERGWRSSGSLLLVYSARCSCTATPGSRILEWFLFSVRTMISFFDPPQVDDLKKGLDLNTEQETVRLILRLAGPVLLAQFVLAVRDRVAR